MKEWITGRNPVYEVLIANRRQVFQIKIANGVDKKGHIAEIENLVQKKHIPLDWVNRNQLDTLSTHHQGVAMQVSAYPYADLFDILEQANLKREQPFVLLLDVLQDPQNFGNLIRSAEAFGVHGIIIPANRAVAVTPGVVHASSGACEHMLIAQGNLVQFIEALKRENVWVVGLENNKEAKPISSIALNGPIGLVVGSEGEGLRELVRKSCDQLTYIPMVGKMESLNAAMAGVIALYLVFSTRQTLSHSSPNG